MKRQLNPERGSVMLVVATVLIALLAGGGIALYITVQGTKSTAYMRANRSALYCAEAGLAAARAALGQDPGLIAALIDEDEANNPAWYPLTGDLDDPPDGEPDYEVIIRDNDDDLPPQANDPTIDRDLGVFVVSRCIKYPETPREVFELVFFELGDTSYRNQSGQGAGNTGNAN